MAIKEHLQLLLTASSSRNWEAWNQWRKEHPELRPDLGEANLSHADLRTLNLSDSSLKRSNLAEADLSGAALNGTDLTDATLRKANLTDADLRSAHLRRADLTGADLTGADLHLADLRGANLTGARLLKARLSPSQLRGTIREEVGLIDLPGGAEAPPIAGSGHPAQPSDEGATGAARQPRNPTAAEVLRNIRLRAKKSRGAQPHRKHTPVDRRHLLGLNEVEHGEPGESAPPGPGSVEEMTAKMQLTERRFEEKKGQMQEEMARTRMRLESDLLRRVEAERHKILLPFLEVLDNLERALASVAQSGSVQDFVRGVELIAGQFRATLQSNGVEAILVLNQPFDPNLGQAVEVVPVTDPVQDGIVVAELRRGYRIGRQLLRPAQVRVGHLDE